MEPEYTPNHVPRSQRVLDGLYAVAILALGALGLFRGELLLPGRRTSGPNGVALQGLPAWLMYAAMACAVCVLLSSVVDHYDRRNNEGIYRRVAHVGKVAGWSLFALALLLHATTSW
jgi:hypothetical protein